MKRTLSLLMILALIMTFSIKEMANDTCRRNNLILSFELNRLIDKKDYSLSKADKKNKMLMDLKCLEDYLLIDSDHNGISIDNITPNGVISYNVSIEDTTNTVTVLSNKPNYTAFKFEEDGKTNCVSIDRKGKIYLDGKEIIVSNDINQPKSKKLFLNASPTCTYSSSPLYGSASSYSKFVKTYTCANVALQTAIKKITIAALTTIIVAVITKNLSLVQKLPIKIAQIIANNLLTIGKQYYPNSAYLSYKISKYTLASKQIGVLGTYNCYKGTYYVQKNYSGTSYKYNCYEQIVSTPGV